MLRLRLLTGTIHPSQATRSSPLISWKQLRIDELKTLLALAAGDEDAIPEGCD